MKYIAIAVVLSLCAASLTLAQTRRLTVYVFAATDPSGLVDKDTKRRLDAVEKIQKRLKTIEKKTFAVSETPEQADLVLEIRGTETVEERNSLAALSNALNRNRPQSAETKLVTYTLATLTVGDYTTELKTKSGPDYGFVKELKDWVKLNAARLPSR